MSFRSLLKKKYFYINILIAIILIIVMIIGTIKWLDSYTRHDEKIELPDFIGIQVDSLIEYTKLNNMKYVIMDSVFDDSKEKGSVVLQNPPPYSNIKTGRTIYVSIVSQAPEMVVLPNLINLSIHQGINLLNNSNIEIGDIRFIEGFDRNAIQKVLFEDEEIMPDTKLLKNSKVTLVASKGTRNQKNLIPNLIGLSEKKAKRMIYENSFNIGRVDFETTHSDTSFYVYYQYPFNNTAYPLGTKINLRLTNSTDTTNALYKEAMFMYDSSFYFEPDSLQYETITDTLIQN